MKFLSSTSAFSRVHLLLFFASVMCFSLPSCNRYGCPAEQEQTKVRKKHKKNKKKSGLFPKDVNDYHGIRSR